MKSAGLQLRNPVGNRATIYVEYSANRKIKRIPTGVKVIASLFNAKNDTILKDGSNDPKKDTAHIQAERDRVNGILRDLYRQLQRDATVEELTAALEAQAAPKPETLTVSEAVTNYIASEGHDWAPATHKNHVTLLNNLKAYHAATKTTWLAATVTADDVKDFQKWLRATYDYENSTLRKRLMMLKKVLKHVGESQPLAINLAKVKPLHSLVDKTPFTLSFADIAAFLALELPSGGYLDRTRDLLILQTMSGLRWGDIQRLHRHHVTPQGIVIKAEKTQQDVSAPLLQPGRDVIAKYTTAENVLELPKRSNQKQNHYLKQLAQLVPALDRLVSVTVDKGAKTVETAVPAWELVTTHTARRSLITCALDLNVPVHVIKQWSGHKTMSAFQRYVNPHNALASATAKFNEDFAAQLSK